MRAGIVTILWVCLTIHLTWNGSAAYSLGRPGILYHVRCHLCTWSSLWEALLLRAISQQRAKIRKGLVPVRTGWVLPGEVTMVTDKRVQKASIVVNARRARCNPRDAFLPGKPLLT